MHLGRLSHLALLDDGTVVGTATQADLEQVLTLHDGEDTSLADGRGAALAAAPHDVVSAHIVDGDALIAKTDPLLGVANPNLPADVQKRLATQAVELAEETPRMPALDLALVGATAGELDTDDAGSFPDAPRGHAIAVVVPVDARDAEMVAETATRRLTTQTLRNGDHFGEVYSELFTDMVIETRGEQPVVVIELTPKSEVTATLLIPLQLSRQLTFLQWAG